MEIQNVSISLPDSWNYIENETDEFHFEKKDGAKVVVRRIAQDTVLVESSYKGVSQVLGKVDDFEGFEDALERAEQYIKQHS